MAIRLPLLCITILTIHFCALPWLPAEVDAGQPLVNMGRERLVEIILSEQSLSGAIDGNHSSDRGAFRETVDKLRVLHYLGWDHLSPNKYRTSINKAVGFIVKSYSGGGAFSGKDEDDINAIEVLLLFYGSTRDPRLRDILLTVESETIDSTTLKNDNYTTVEIQRAALLDFIRRSVAR